MAKETSNRSLNSQPSGSRPERQRPALTLDGASATTSSTALMYLCMLGHRPPTASQPWVDSHTQGSGEDTAAAATEAHTLRMQDGRWPYPTTIHPCSGYQTDTLPPGLTPWPHALLSRGQPRGPALSLRARPSEGHGRGTGHRMTL